jgi:hypothetical protein
MRDHFTPAADMARVSASMSRDLMLIVSITLFAILCLGGAVVAMPGNIKTWEAAHVPV